MSFKWWFGRSISCIDHMSISFSIVCIWYDDELILTTIMHQSMTMEASGSLNLIRTFRIAMFGLLILGPAQHVWFNYLGKILPKRDMITTFKKLIVGQIFYGPSCTAVFFTYNASLQGMTSFLHLCFYQLPAFLVSLCIL